jgi:hypothetical protein
MARAAEYQQQKQSLGCDQERPFRQDTRSEQTVIVRSPSSKFDPFSSTALPKIRSAPYLLSYCTLLPS